MAPLRRIVSTCFDLGEAPLSDAAVCQKLGISTLDIAQAVQRTLPVFFIMGLIGSGLSFNPRLANNGVNVSFWILSSWPRFFTTSLQTWEIRADNGKDGKRSSLASLLCGSVS